MVASPFSTNLSKFSNLTTPDAFAGEEENSSAWEMGG